MGVSLPPVPDEEAFRHWQEQQANTPAVATLAPPPRAAADDTGTGKLPPVPDEADFEKWKAAQPRGVKAGVGDVVEAVKHPIETAKGMANAVAEGLNKATAPIVGMPTNLLRIPGRPTGRVTKETPGAVEPKEALKGMGESAINVGFALAPELALPVRLGVNAALGAVHNTEDPLRGATGGALLGEALHGATKGAGKVLGKAADVSGGAVEAGAEALKPPPAPPPTGAQRALKARLAAEYGITPEAIGKIGRRPAPPKEAIPEPPPEAQTYVTKGAVRRPKAAPAGPKEYVPSTDPRSAEPEAAHIRQVAQSLKTGADPAAVSEAAAEMAARIPKGAILVPVPGHAGPSPGIEALAAAIAQHVEGAEVMPAVQRTKPVASSFVARHAGQPGVSLEEHTASLSPTGELPPGRPVVMIDNVETSGATGEAVRRALGRTDAELVTYAKAPIPPGEAPLERRAAPEPERAVWTPEERATHIAERQKAFAGKINRPWSQWTPEERHAYFADQAQAKAEAPWKPKTPPPKGNVDAETTDPGYIPTVEAVRYAIKELGGEGFKKEVLAQPHLQSKPGTGEPPTPGMTATGVETAAREIVRRAQQAETAHFPPEPKPGDITPVASSNSEFNVRPGVMRDVNKGEQPAALASPLRLPEPSAADRAVVQPKGYKEVSPEEVAARKAAERPEPVITEHPVRQEMPEGAKVDEQGLFFDHRTPNGALRPFNRVSTDGLIKAQRELMDSIQRDRQAAIYRNVEADVSGTQYGQHINVGDRTERGTTYQAEAAERLRNYEKVQGRLNQELEKRGLTNEDIHARMLEQEDLEAAIEQEAIHHADSESAADEAFGDFGETNGAEGGTNRPSGETKGPKGEPPISDVLNVAKLNLGSKTAEQRMAGKLEEFRAQREANKQTFAEADVNRAEILNELRAGDPKALPTDRAKQLSGEELLARRDLVRENDGLIQSLSKRLEAAATPEEHAQAAELLEKAVAHNDALLSDLVTGSSQKGRDLNLLRRMAIQSLDPDVWRVQAKRMLGDKPLTAEIDAMIRKLAQEASDACG